jgi:hypothetical protein
MSGAAYRAASFQYPAAEQRDFLFICLFQSTRMKRDSTLTVGV